MPKHTTRFLMVAILVAWGIDFLFWGKSIGLSFVIWVLIVLIGALTLALSEGIHPSRFSLLLILIILSLSGTTLLRAESLTRFINAAMALGALALLAATFRNGYWTLYRLVDYGMSLLQLIQEGFYRPGKFLQISLYQAEIAASNSDNKQEAPHTNQGETQERAKKSQSILRKSLHQIAPFLRGLLLALPIIVILASLLSSADLVFAQNLKDFLKLFNLPNLLEYLFRLSYTLCFAYLFLGFYLHAILPRYEQPRPNPMRPAIQPFLGWIETNIVLICVDLLFAFFVVIQFRYLFGGQANIIATGYTYSEYARRGFSELVAVAVLSLLLYHSLGSISHLESPQKKRVFTFLTTLLIALVLVILASALQRLLLYEGAYGFSRLRTYTHVFIYWMALFLVIILLLELFQRRGHFALALILVSFGFALSLALLNVDGFIVRKNIERTHQGYTLDSQYLSRLSEDAVPVLVQMYTTNLPREVHNTVTAELACRALNAKQMQSEPWQSYHPVRSMARRMLLQQDAPWLGALHYQSNGNWWVKIGGSDYPCYHYGWD